MKHPLVCMSEALQSALSKDLPEINFRNRRTDEIKRTIRPSAEYVSVEQFPQVWPSTALGFGGIGGSAFTTAYTTIVTLNGYSISAVYFGGTFAYLVSDLESQFRRDVEKRQVLSVLRASQEYTSFAKDKDNYGNNGSDSNIETVS